MSAADGSPAPLRPAVHRAPMSFARRQEVDARLDALRRASPMPKAIQSRLGGAPSPFRSPPVPEWPTQSPAMTSSHRLSKYLPGSFTPSEPAAPARVPPVPPLADAARNALQLPFSPAPVKADQTVMFGDIGTNKPWFDQVAAAAANAQSSAPYWQAGAMARRLVVEKYPSPPRHASGSPKRPAQDRDSPAAPAITGAEEALLSPCPQQGSPSPPRSPTPASTATARPPACGRSPVPSGAPVAIVETNPVAPVQTPKDVPEGALPSGDAPERIPSEAPEPSPVALKSPLRAAPASVSKSPRKKPSVSGSAVVRALQNRTGSSSTSAILSLISSTPGPTGPSPAFARRLQLQQERMAAAKVALTPTSVKSVGDQQSEDSRDGKVASTERPSKNKSTPRKQRSTEQAHSGTKKAPGPERVATKGGFDCICLDGWHVSMEGSFPVISGVDSKTTNRVDGRILQRRSQTLAVIEGNRYVLLGSINRVAMQRAGYGSAVIAKFESGLPESWAEDMKAAVGRVDAASTDHMAPLSENDAETAVNDTAETGAKHVVESASKKSAPNPARRSTGTVSKKFATKPAKHNADVTPKTSASKAAEVMPKKSASKAAEVMPKKSASKASTAVESASKTPTTASKSKKSLSKPIRKVSETAAATPDRPVGPAEMKQKASPRPPDRSSATPVENMAPQLSESRKRSRPPVTTSPVAKVDISLTHVVPVNEARGLRTSRSGRRCMPPLKFWLSERFVAESSQVYTAREDPLPPPPAKRRRKSLSVSSSKEQKPGAASHPRQRSKSLGKTK
ncbi:SANTA domain-containing protein [Plasmodiophora brassicae]|uniref:SANTA domain-containing protein n=1 Tax=Plasmodiophora brassicae TaxID=37360 RepID=A0A0G4IVI6_PLABS|nr:hypothetical protein PBRA_001029 [Plasmodiophora brassicae]SPQ97142.1 unnamed protein product [Plasmodiophora brassicae]